MTVSTIVSHEKKFLCVNIGGYGKNSESVEAINMEKSLKNKTDQVMPTFIRYCKEQDEENCSSFA